MSAKIRIVTVENGQIPDDALQKALASENYEVVSSSAPRLLTDIACTPVDVILLPLSLPDSIALISRIRALGPYAIIVITQQHEAVAAALDAGADDYLAGSLTASLLHNRVRHAITYQQNHMAIDELRSRLDAAESAQKSMASSSQDFCRDLAHDLNNTLTGIIMTAEMLLMEKPSGRTTSVIREIIELADEIDSTIKTRRASLQSDR